jgi:hypothetical protein
MFVVYSPLWLFPLRLLYDYYNQTTSLEMIRTFPYIMAEVGKGEFWLSAIDSFEKLASKSGAMTETEATSWANALHKASDKGVFFGASNYYTYMARRPE